MAKRKVKNERDQPNLKRLRSEIAGVAKNEQRFRYLFIFFSLL